MRGRNDRGRLRRAVVAAVVVTMAVAAFAAFGGISLANGVISAAQYQYGGHKVTICHKSGKKGKEQTLTISAKAWPAHQRRGDQLGSCASLHHANRGKHNGETHHASNPATGSGTTTTSTTSHGNSGSAHGNSANAPGHTK